MYRRRAFPKELVTWQYIVSVMVYIVGDEYREAVNTGWASMFPERHNLPTRQTLYVLPNGLQEGLFAAAVMELV